MKSAEVTRPAHRSWVSTSGRGSPNPPVAGVEHDGQPGPAARRHPDHVADPQPLQRRRPRRPGAASAPWRASARSRSAIATRSAKYSSKSPWWQAASAPYASMVSLVALHLPGQADHRPVRLELRERRLQQVAGAVRADRADQVDRHVVRRAEARPQRVGAGRGEPGHVPRVDLRRPHHHGVPLDVDAAAAGPAGELGVLPRRQVDVRLAVELDQPLQHHAPGRHVDAQRQRLGGEDRLDQAADEQLLDDLLERRQHAGVVGGQAALQPVEPLPVAQDRQVLAGDAR